MNALIRPKYIFYLYILLSTPSASFENSTTTHGVLGRISVLIVEVLSASWHFSHHWAMIISKVQFWYNIQILYLRKKTFKKKKSSRTSQFHDRTLNLKYLAIFIILILPKTKVLNFSHINKIWAASSEFGPYRLCEQRRFRRACAFAQSRQNLRCSLIQAVSQEEPSDRKPDPWPLWMAGHAQLKFVMTECSKTQIRLTRPIFV